MERYLTGVPERLGRSRRTNPEQRLEGQLKAAGFLCGGPPALLKLLYVLCNVTKETAPIAVDLLNSLGGRLQGLMDKHYPKAPCTTMKELRGVFTVNTRTDEVPEKLGRILNVYTGAALTSTWPSLVGRQPETLPQMFTWAMFAMMPSRRTHAFLSFVTAILSDLYTLAEQTSDGVSGSLNGTSRSFCILLVQFCASTRPTNMNL